MAYITVPIETDEDVTANDAFSYIASAFPGWVPNEGQLEVWVILAAARMAADLKDQVSTVGDDAFRYFGSLMGVTPFDDVPASVLTTWNLLDTAGHTITAGMLVGILDANLDVHEFQVSSDVVVAAGSATALHVPLTSTDPGADQNGLGGVGAVATSLDGVAWVGTITLEAATSGGQDAEDDTTYLGRLTDTLRTMTPRPIIPGDFAILARDIAGVYRATAIDGYDPISVTYGNEKTIAVAAADSNGNAVSAGIKTQIDAYLQSLRELNFVVNVIDPTYTTIDVQWDVNLWPGYDPVSTAADINAIISSFLSPATWGTPPGGDPTQWYNRTTVKVNDMIALLGAEAAVEDVNSVTMRTGGAGYATADIVLTGAAPLPRPGAIGGTTH